LHATPSSRIHNLSTPRLLRDLAELGADNALRTCLLATARMMMSNLMLCCLDGGPSLQGAVPSYCVLGTAEKQQVEQRCRVGQQCRAATVCDGTSNRAPKSVRVAPWFSGSHRNVRIDLACPTMQLWVQLALILEGIRPPCNYTMDTLSTLVIYIPVQLTQRTRPAVCFLDYEQIRSPKMNIFG
jgi:hypothetical protein